MAIKFSKENFMVLMFFFILLRFFILIRIDAMEGHNVIGRLFLGRYGLETFFPFPFRKVEDRHLKRLRIANALLALFWIMFFGLILWLHFSN